MARLPDPAADSPAAAPAWLTTGAASARILMGLVLVVAGIVKCYEPVLFYWETISYLDLLHVGREAWPDLARLTLILAPLEVLVGGALIAGWRSRITMPVASALMVLFLVVTGMAWHQEAPIDCGCFGTLAKRTPGQALAEDAVMFVLLLAAWRWGTRKWTAAAWAPAPKVVALVAAASFAVLLVRFGPESDRISSSDLKPGVRLVGLELSGIRPMGAAAEAGDDLDLGQGRYLVELFSPRCGHCRAAVPKLNHWADTPGVPPIVALNEFPPDSPYLTGFLEQLRPRYTVASISSSDFMRLTWRHGYPRLAYVEDGVIRAVWERESMPSTAHLQRLGGGG